MPVAVLPLWRIVVRNRTAMTSLWSAVAGQECAHRRVGVARDLGFGHGFVGAGEHGPVHRYPEQQPNEVMGGHERVVDGQLALLVQPPEVGCEGSENALEAS